MEHVVWLLQAFFTMLPTSRAQLPTV